MDINQLPAECISSILAFTSPKDACRSPVVSPTFKYAADSDALWTTFLPSDYRQIISQASSSSTSSFLDSLPKKDLYFRLCDHLLFIGSGNSVNSNCFIYPNLNFDYLKFNSISFRLKLNLYF